MIADRMWLDPWPLAQITTWLTVPKFLVQSEGNENVRSFLIQAEEEDDSVRTQKVG